MSPTIKPTVKDPHCLDFRRMPAGMEDPVYDEEAGEAHALRDAANFTHCYKDCMKKACRHAKACMAPGALTGADACVSPDFGDQVRLLAVYLSVHAVNIRERHRAWDIARLCRDDLPAATPWLSGEQEAALRGEEDAAG